MTSLRFRHACAQNGHLLPRLTIHKMSPANAGGAVPDMEVYGYTSMVPPAMGQVLIHSVSVVIALANANGPCQKPK